MISTYARRFLVGLLADLAGYDIDVLIRLTREIDPALRGHLRTSSFNDAVNSLVDVLVSRGLVNARLVDILANEWPARAEDLEPLRVELGLRPPASSFLPADLLERVLQAALDLNLHAPMPIAALRVDYEIAERVAEDYGRNPAGWLQRALRVADRLADAQGQPAALRRWLSWARGHAPDNHVFAEAEARLRANLAPETLESHGQATRPRSIDAPPPVATQHPNATQPPNGDRGPSGEALVDLLVTWLHPADLARILDGEPALRPLRSSLGVGSWRSVVGRVVAQARTLGLLTQLEAALHWERPEILRGESSGHRGESYARWTPAAQVLARSVSSANQANALLAELGLEAPGPFGLPSVPAWWARVLDTIRTEPDYLPAFQAALRERGLWSDPALSRWLERALAPAERVNVVNLLRLARARALFELRRDEEAADTLEKVLPDLREALLSHPEVEARIALGEALALRIVLHVEAGEAARASSLIDELATLADEQAHTHAALGLPPDDTVPAAMAAIAELQRLREPAEPLAGSPQT